MIDGLLWPRQVHHERSFHQHHFSISSAQLSAAALYAESDLRKAFRQLRDVLTTFDIRKITWLSDGQPPALPSSEFIHRIFF